MIGLLSQTVPGLASNHAKGRTMRCLFVRHTILSSSIIICLIPKVTRKLYLPQAMWMLGHPSVPSRNRDQTYDSLFHHKQQNSLNSEASVSPLNMEDDVLGHVENELPDFIFGRRNAKLWPQTGVSHENPSTKSVVKVFNRHKQMTNLEHLILPPMPKVLTIVILWDFVSSREKNVYYVQQAVVQSAYILSSRAS